MFHILYFRHVCDLPHVKKLFDDQPLLKLMPHNSDGVFERFKVTLVEMMWQGLGNCSSRMFVDKNGNAVTVFDEHQLISADIYNYPTPTLDQWVSLTFSSGKTVKARIDEEFVYSAMYVNEDVVKSLGKEMCIALDVALAASGCEAVVEGFYSLINAHKKSGGQSNDVLVQRAIVDWSLPMPASCPGTMRAIASLYTQGDNSHKLPKHRLPVFVDSRERATRNYENSKVIDRIKHEPPRCPHVLNESDKYN